MKFRIWSYNRKCESVVKLSEALDTPILYKDGKYIPEPGDYVLNWGSSTLLEKLQSVNWFNHPRAVALAVNKHSTFQEIGDYVPIPEYTTDPKTALEWVKKSSVYARMSLTGKAGSGIIVVGVGSSEVPIAELYTKTFPKTSEYRVHVFHLKFKVFEKVKDDLSNAGIDYKFVPAVLPEEITNSAIAAVELLGLDFGAVDIGFDAKTGKHVVFEVNTAPALPGATLGFYVTNICLAKA